MLPPSSLISPAYKKLSSLTFDFLPHQGILQDWKQPHRLEFPIRDLVPKPHQFPEDYAAIRDQPASALQVIMLIGAGALTKESRTASPRPCLASSLTTQKV